MKARRVIESASDFDAATLKVLCNAFDDAWSEIEPHFAGDEPATEHARMSLAYAVLIVAREGDDSPEQVKNDCFAGNGFGRSASRMSNLPWRNKRAPSGGNARRPGGRLTMGRS